MRKLPLRRSLSNMGSPVLSCSVPSLRGQPVDVFDVTHIERGSPLDWEIHATGITIFENAI